MINPDRINNSMFRLSGVPILAEELYDHVVVEGNLDAISLLQAKDIRNNCAVGRLTTLIKTNLHKEAFKSIVLNISKGHMLYSIADLVNIISEANHTDGQEDDVNRLPIRVPVFTCFKYQDAAKETYQFQEWMRSELNDPTYTIKNLILSMPMKTRDDIQNVIGLGVLLQSRLPSQT